MIDFRLECLRLALTLNRLRDADAAAVVAAAATFEEFISPRSGSTQPKPASGKVAKPPTHDRQRTP